MKNFLQKISIKINYKLFKKEVPLCYTAYEKKSFFYKIINFLFFWQKNHCRKVYLTRRRKNENKKAKEGTR